MFEKLSEKGLNFLILKMLQGITSKNQDEFWHTVSWKIFKNENDDFRQF